MNFLNPFSGTPVSHVGSKNVTALIDSINEAARQANAAALVFLATTIYFAVTASSTTDEQLLLNTPLSLPLLNVGVVVRTFYRVAPWLIVFLHLNLLLLEYVLAYRIHRLPAEALNHNADRLVFFPSVVMRLKSYHFLVPIFLRALFLAGIAFLPAVVLVIIQAKFLPYHHKGITRWHQWAVASDLLLVWLFLFIRPRSDRKRTIRSKLLRWDVVLFFLASIGLIAFSGWVARIPKSCEPTWIDRLLPHRNLWLNNRPLSANPPAEKGVNLSGRDLRCADFSDSVMVNTNFRGASLQGANFTGANLQGSDFTSLRVTPRSLLNLDLEQVEKGIFYVPTNLEEAIFNRADLRHAKLRSAEMRAAQMGESDLRAADFSSAHLNHADLTGARLFAADFTSAEMRGASFQGAQLQGARFPRAKVEFANFSGAVLEGANLAFARADGAEFTGAFLQGAVGLPLQRIDLRNARLAHADFCRSGDRPGYVDWRGARFEEEPWSDLDKEKKDLTRNLSTVEESIKASRTAPSCFYKGKVFPSKAWLYDKEQAPQQGWPASQIEEDLYDSRLADELVDRACRDRDDDSLVVLEALASRATERALIDPEDSLAIKLVWRLRQEMVKEEVNEKCVPSETAQRRIMMASSALCGAKRISPCFSH